MGFISAPGPLELMVILVIALIVLGPQKLPEAARSVGKGMRELRESLTARRRRARRNDYETREPASAPEAETHDRHATTTRPMRTRRARASARRLSLPEGAGLEDALGLELLDRLRCRRPS